MSKRTHVLLLTFVAIIGIFVAYQIAQRSFLLPGQSSAKVPESVGDKAAPVPVLRVTDSSLSRKNDISTTQIQRSISSAVSGQGITPKYSLVEYQLNWNVSVEDGSMAPVMAQVFVPVLPAGQEDQKLPILVYGAGTTGLADRCAPSREDLSRGNMGDFRNYMIAEASQGFVVVMPNYEGFDNPNRDQHYFNKDSEARTMLSAGKALNDSAPTALLPTNPDALFFGGYSQGGHAAFSAADYANLYLPDLKVAGIIGHGPTNIIVDYLLSNPNLAAYFVASYSDYYPAIDPATILTPEWVGYLDRAREICVDEGFGNGSTTVNRVYSPAFALALREKAVGIAFPEINKVFVENNAGTDYTDIPTFIAQGTADTIVTSKNQNIFIDELCARGVPVTLQEYRGGTHFATRQISFKDTNNWMTAISQGQPTANICTARR